MRLKDLRQAVSESRTFLDRGQLVGISACLASICLCLSVCVCVCLPEFLPFNLFPRVSVCPVHFCLVSELDEQKSLHKASKKLWLLLQRHQHKLKNWEKLQAKLKVCILLLSIA